MAPSKCRGWDFPGGLAVRSLPSNAGAVGSIPLQGTKILHASRSENQNIKQKEYCNKFNKDFENGSHKKKNTHKNKVKGAVRAVLSLELLRGFTLPLLPLPPAPSPCAHSQHILLLFARSFPPLCPSPPTPLQPLFPSLGSFLGLAASSPSLPSLCSDSNQVLTALLD